MTSTPPQHKYLKKITHLPPAELSFKQFDNLLHTAKLPETVDLRPKCPPVYDQGQLGSCTANALCGIFQYDDPAFMGSRLFLYYNERAIEGNTGEDSGAELHDGIRSLKKAGICSETSWPYDISKFEEKPPAECYTEGLIHKALSVQNVKQDINSMKNALAQNYPFVVGFEVFEEFESDEVAQTGIVPMPKADSELLGGHAVVCVGYNKDYWIVRNSWSTDWGDEGYFYLPIAYLLDRTMASDLWIIKKVEMESDEKKQPVKKGWLW